MKKIIVLIVILLAFGNMRAQVSSEFLKASWIFIIADNVTFPNESQIDTFKIAIYGKNSGVYKEIKDKKLDKEKTIKGKPVIVDNISRLQDLLKYNIIYLDESKNDFIEAVYNKIHNKGKLLITYNNDDQNHIMINLLLKDRENQFQIQSSNLYDEKIVANERLISLGGTKIDIKGLYEKKVRELNKKKQELVSKEIELQEKENHLRKLEEELKKKEEDNQRQLAIIKKQNEQLAKTKKNLQQVLEKIAEQEKILNKNQFILANLNKEIRRKQNLIKQKDKELENKKLEVQKKQHELLEEQKRIQKQKEDLKNLNVQVKTQRGIINITIIFIVVFLTLSIIIWRALAQNKKINRQLSQKNKEIEKQKDELKKQAAQLEEFNKELSKLSLVASKTDNSVIIMDKEGYFEWVNPGFTRLYGYTLQLLRQELGTNIIDISDNKKYKKELIDTCVNEKRTIVYQAKNKTRDGKEIWVQTAITPVLDENDNVIKLIAIESNITRLKEQEAQIKQTNEELQMQKAELQAQKDMLEEVNKQIKDSIHYAQTIQKAILPLDKDIENHFAFFIIYMPRDIVSGDFYWFSNPKPNTFFMAAVDCTGHGVPGAFMSLISSRMLDELVSVRKIYEPAEILTQLNKMIIEALSQKNTNNRDGMDLALVRLDKVGEKYNVIFSGAKRPLIYYEKGTELKVIKGNRRSVGGIRASSDYIFEQQQLVLHKKDLIYLTTDGMIDQNNKARKRFGTPRFMQLLDRVKDLPIYEQKEVIISEFNKFREDQEQRDDITVWGIKL